MSGIYIHWPYCISKCPYCDFNSFVADEYFQEEMLECYLQELKFYKNQNYPIKSILFGGGTPSLMKPFLVEKILEFIAKNFSLKNPEITLEANPNSVEANKFKAFKLAGINRVSIGVQSFSKKNLEFLGRKHSEDEAKNAIKIASKIFDKFSFDLMYALPGQTLKDWQNELQEAMNLAGSHISLYQLTIKKGTPFYSDFKKNKFEMIDSKIAAKMYEYTENFLKERNIFPYEISNYASKNNECLHNLNYWNYGYYIGIGPGAHGRIKQNNCRVAAMNIHDPKNWMEKTKKSGNGIQTSENLSISNQAQEAIMMGLRITKGINKNNFKKNIGSEIENFLNPKKLEFLEKKKFIKNSEQKIAITKKGRLLLTKITQELLLDL